MNKPLISVIIPAYNCEKTIETAIDSIINQTYKNLEIIVIDDNSSDGTREVVQGIMARANGKVKLMKTKMDDSSRFDAKLNRNINAGYSARNTGFKHAQGEYITFQDADDASLLNRIEVQYELLKKYNATHVTTDWIQFDEKYAGKKFDIDTFNKKYKIDFIEVFNSRTLYDEDNKTALRFAEKNRKRQGYLAIAGTDAHTVGEVGNCCNMVRDFDVTKRNEFLKAFSNPHETVFIAKKSSPVYHLITKTVKLLKLNKTRNKTSIKHKKYKK